LRARVPVAALVLLALAPVGGALAPGELVAAAATPSTGTRPHLAADSRVSTESQLRRAWTNPMRRRIDLGADIVLRDCWTGDPIRESPYPLVLDGHGHTIRQACFEKRLLRQDGTGFLDIRDVTLTRGGSDGPGAALTSRGEIVLRDCSIRQNLSEEPGGGVFSMRRVTVHRCHIDGNLANDDGGGLYARRGGVQVFDSVLSNNLVDGSGGAVGSTGDILVVRSRVDGNTTDGDGGALYTDEDGDVTVIDSLVDGSDADGPGGAIFTLDGDVAVLGSTLIGNRADDRGGAIAGEADVLVVNSTVARNLAVAHAGGGVWARGRLALVNATVTNNYAEGEGGGTLAAGTTSIIASTLTQNIAPVGADVGSGGTLDSFASIIGPPVTEGVTGDTIPTRRACRLYAAVSRGYNVVSDSTCELDSRSDLIGVPPDLARLEDDPMGFVLEPEPDSPVRGVIPSGKCRGRLPDPLPAGQLLAAYVDWSTVLEHDAIGRVRDSGRPCDVGAVQSLPAGAHPALRGAALPAEPPGSVGPVAPVPAPPGDHPATSAPVERRTVLAPRPTRPAAGLDAQLDRLEHRLRALDHDVARFGVLEDCISEVPVDVLGDRRHRWGFLYTERDGTGVDRRTALSPHRKRPGAPQLRLLRLSIERNCLSAAPDPNGTGADARTTSPTRARSRDDLARRLARLRRVADRVEARADRFDAWESCLSWVPTTQSGEDWQDFGYRTASPRAAGPTHRGALDLDLSEWDDPDYELLAFRGRDRPFGPGECGSEPGEAVDRVSAHGPGRRGDLRDDVADLTEDVEDLAEPVGEITQFDQCMFTVGVSTRSDFVFENRGGRRSSRAALSYDLRGRALPEQDLIAFPGEEPPQIECNEDAAGEGTDE
jgi:hypothetical protein